MSKFELTLTDRQDAAWEALHDPEVREVMYGGAKGGGKSHLLCSWVYQRCYELARKYDLKPSKHPPHVGWMGRKQACDFVGTTLATWQEIIPEGHYELRGGTEKAPRHISLFGNRICVDYGGLDRQANIQRFNSAQYIFICIDQAEETTQDEVSVLRGSRRMKLNGESQDYKGLWTANPRLCWLKQRFVDRQDLRFRFVPALPGDNPYLPDDYVQTLQEAFEHRPELLEAYLHGSWDVLAGADQVIRPEWLREAAGKTIGGMVRRPRLVCDTARFGDDETVIFYGETTDIEHQHFMPHCRETEITDKLLDLHYKYNCPVCVESTGNDLGAGVIDNLTRKEAPVIQYTPQGKPNDKKKYYNSRAEAWGETAKAFAKGQIQLQYKCGSDHDRMVLQSQLCAPTYKFKNKGQVVIAPKEEIKELLGTSPDRGDAYVMLYWSYSRAPALPEYDIFDDNEDEDVALSYATPSVF